jgi:molybdate transport system substrate-binding protein
MKPWITLGLLLAVTSPAAAQSPRLVVSVATSIHDAMQEVAEQYRVGTGVAIDLNTAGSNTLARQIVDGAKVDVFVSADDLQMDVVEREGRLVPGTRVHLLTNELVVVVPVDPKSTLTPASLIEGRVRRLAMGDPTGVPVGVYGKKWLEHEGAWARLQPTIVPFLSVRAVLTAVESGRVDAGIVYKTDAQTSKALVLLRIPAAANAYLNIIEPAALVKGGHEAEARRFLAYLRSAPAREIFARRGFGLP